MLLAPPPPIAIALLDQLVVFAVWVVKPPRSFAELARRVGSMLSGVGVGVGVSVDADLCAEVDVR